MSDIGAIYNQYFAVVPAEHGELQDQAYRLRYQVYCVENPFEDPATQVGEREMDRYDPHSVHAVLIYRPSGLVMGCVRLVLPTQSGTRALPIWELLTASARQRLEQSPQDRVAEISRYAVSKQFRRRKGETMYADTGFFDLPEAESHRIIPHITLGLMHGVGVLAAQHGITEVCAAMAPALLRLLQRFGLNFEVVGPPVDYHGERVPCVATCETLLSGLAARNQDYYQFVDAAYRGQPVAQSAD